MDHKRVQTASQMILFTYIYQSIACNRDWRASQRLLLPKIYGSQKSAESIPKAIFTCIYLSMNHKRVQRASQKNFFTYSYLKIDFREHPKGYSFPIFMDHKKF